MKRKWYTSRLLPFLVGVHCCVLSLAQAGKEWQYCVPVGNTGFYASLYIPPSCTYVKGVLIASDLLMLRPILEDSVIRATAAKHQLGIVLLHENFAKSKALFGAGFDYEKREDTLVDKMFNDLAIVSGYAELANTPFLPLSHSGTQHFANALCYWKPERAIAVIPMKTSLLDKPKGAPANNIQSVPVLMVVGQFEEWSKTPYHDREDNWRKERNNILNQRTNSNSNIMGQLVDIGDGHFAHSPQLIRVLSLFISKACALRIPKAKTPNGVVKLQSIAPEQGWLTDTALATHKAVAQIAPYRQYKGNKQRAYWYFDKEMASAVRLYGRADSGKQNQLATVWHNNRPHPINNKVGIIDDLVMQPLPNGDGQTFVLKATFFDTIPSALVNAGTPIGHATSPPPSIEIIRGPVVKLASDTFRLQFSNGNTPYKALMALMAYHPGNSLYRKTVEPIYLKYPIRNTQGVPQTIAFAPIKPVRYPFKSVPLVATSSSGLPVSFYVVNGPAYISGNQLYVTPIPVKSKYPIEITVVAYQWGRSIAPLYQSAEPVVQRLLIEK